MVGMAPPGMAAPETPGAHEVSARVLACLGLAMFEFLWRAPKIAPFNLGEFTNHCYALSSG